MARVHHWRERKGTREPLTVGFWLACWLTLLLVLPTGGSVQAGPEEAGPGKGVLPVKEDEPKKGDDSKKDGDKGGDSKGGDSKGGDAKDDGAKGADEAPKTPFWKASESEGLHVTGISGLVMHPKVRNTLWAHVHGLGPAVSTDGGRTWEVRLAGVGEKERPTVRSQVRISLDPGDAKTLYLVIDGQIYKSEDGGSRWTSITSGALASLSWDQFKSTHLSWEVIVDPKKSVHLLVGTRNDGDHNGGLYESTNGGKSWAEIAGSAQADTGLGADTFLVRLNPSSDKYITVAGRRGVWYSDSRGREFTRNDPGGLGIHDIRGMSDYTGKELYLADARGIWRSKDGGKRWDKKPVREGDALGIFSDPHNRKRIFAVFADRGVEVSEDGRKAKWSAYGGHFGPVAEGETPPNDGYRGALVREVFVHPRDRKVVFLASPVTGLHVSSDGGKTFAPVTAPEDAKEGTVAPSFVPPMALVATRDEANGTVLALSDDGLLFRRTGGTTWARLGPLGMHASAIVPGAAAGQWFALGYGLRRSLDDGQTWDVIWPTEKDKKGKHPEERVASIHVAPDGTDDDGKAVPGTITLLLERSGSLLTSSDGGGTWKEHKGPKLPSSETWASHLAVNPANADHMVIAASTTRESFSPRDENGGLWQTWDGGKSWKPITGSLAPDKKDDAAARKAKAWWNRATFLAIDPVAGLIVYAADRRGIFTHPIVDPKGPKAKTTPTWFEVTPTDLPTPTIAAMTKTLTPDKASTRYVAQLLGSGEASSVVSITGAALKALHEALANAAEAKANAAEVYASHPWETLEAPAAGVRFTAIAPDPAGPNRFLASERDGPGGIHTYVDPTAKAAEPKKDEPKKDGPKKDEGTDTGTTRRTPPEGMRAFTAGQDKLWRVWGVDTGTSTGQMIGHENVVTCIGLAPDETQIVTGSDDRTVRFWDAQSAKPLGSVTIEGSPRDLAFDDDSAFVYVAAGPGNSLVQIKLADRSMKVFEGHKGAVTCVACSEDTSRVYSGGDDQVVLGWDAAKGTQVLSIAVGSPVVALTVAADGSRFYAAGADNSIAVFDAAGKPAGRVEGLASPARGLALAPGGARLYATTTNGVAAIDTATMKVAATHAAPDAGELTCVTVSSDGVWILAGDAAGGLWIWQEGTPEAYRPRAQAHEGGVRGVAITPEETAAAGAPKSDAPKDDPPKGDAPKDEAPKDEAPKDEAPKNEAPKDEAPKDDGSKGEAPKKRP